MVCTFILVYIYIFIYFYFHHISFSFLGWHHFYMRNFAIGFLYLFTFGVYGVGWVLDGFFMPSLVDQSNTKEKYTTDLEILKTYLIAASPFGVLGGHQYYSGRKLWGLSYTLTLGGCGVWWMIDLFRISAIVHRRKQWKLGINLHKIYADDVYLIWILFGLLGGHHFYMRRFKAGFLYMCTFGCLGVGWLVDIIRIPWMVRDYNFAHSLEDDLVFSDAVMESLSDFDRKIIQRAIRRARYSGEDNSIYEDETDDDDRMCDKESCNHEFDQIRSSIRSLQRPKFQVGDNEELERQNHRSHSMSKITTVAIISNPDESIMSPAKKDITETLTLTHENEKHSDDIEIERTNSRKRSKSHQHETTVILNPNSLSNGLNEQSGDTEIYTRSMDRKRALTKDCSILKRDSGSRNDNVVQVRNKGRRVSFHFDDRKMNVDEQDNSSPTIDNNENSESQEDCQTDQPKESNPIQTENLEIKQYRRINRRVKSDAALEMADNRKRKLNRSNTQVASLSWQDPVENNSSVVSNLIIEQTNNDNSTTCEGNVNQGSLPRITKIRSIKRSKSRGTKAKSMVSSATTQTSPRTPRNESDININYDLASDSFVQNGSLENHIENSNKNDNDACQNISEGVLHIVTSATVDNVFDDIEEIKVDHGTRNSTPTPSSELCRPVRDTGIGFQNIIPEYKPGTKRSMSFPSRQISLEQDKVVQNGHVLVVDDGESPFMPVSESMRSTKRLSPQPGLNGWTNIDQEVTRPIRRSSMNTDNSGWTSGNKIYQPVRRASTQSAGMSKWTDEERKPRKRKVSLMPKITRAKSGRI